MSRIFTLQIEWGSLDKAVMCQSTISALLRAAALLVREKGGYSLFECVGISQ